LQSHPAGAISTENFWVFLLNPWRAVKEHRRIKDVEGFLEVMIIATSSKQKLEKSETRDQASA
jgi:hypothetical protein